MSNYKGLAHIGVYTDDIEKSKKFYIENFGFKLFHESVLDNPDNSTLQIAFIDLNGMILELLHSSNKSENKYGNNGSIEHLAIEVKNLEPVMEELRQKGIVFETENPIKIEKLFKGVQAVFFRGPSGERLELFEFLEQNFIQNK